ncbi:alpha/beta hydrolase [Chitinasiproducens palmae]|uniref:Acyl-CoA:diacylglycerol acyltransferase n=1 Tax=Chitinasiproducens palmae TaxID=1770053 RepID=A0A1H2PT42_9BURK|nr:alpha/beta hydrolase-fold protein [Chitinasiproducens palmae]SDV50271.1 hypothetical protein SAMN05216551_11147 [Chitinasiproducens palmae]
MTRHPRHATDLPRSAQRRNLLTGIGAAAMLAACAAPRPTAPGARFDPGRPMGPTVWDAVSNRYAVDQLPFVSADGARRYRVWLATPRGAVPASGHPLICMTDGNAVADSLTSSDLEAAARAGDLPVIVAIGPDSDTRFDVAARAFDYTPPVRQDGPTFEDETRGRLGGGADLFLDLIARHIMPAVASRVPLDARRLTLWGHSYGGLLVLHTLFRHPTLFTRYAAADPSLWWHQGFILQEAEAALPLPAGQDTTLLLMAGTAPQPAHGPNPTAAARQARALRAAVPPGGARRLAERLAQRAHLAVLYREFPSLSHGPMLPASLRPALELAARGIAHPDNDPAKAGRVKVLD